jgi:hypothetical protein
LVESLLAGQAEQSQDDRIGHGQIYSVQQIAVHSTWHAKGGQLQSEEMCNPGRNI